jgi:hypothetical protein
LPLPGRRHRVEDGAEEVHAGRHHEDELPLLGGLRTHYVN